MTEFTDIPPGKYSFTAGRGSKIEFEVQHKGYMYERLALVIKPHITFGDSETLDPKIELQVIVPSLPYEGSGCFACSGAPQDAIVIMTGCTSEYTLTVTTLWVICHIVFTMWPNRLTFALMIPKSIFQHNRAIQAQMQGLAYFSSSTSDDYDEVNFKHYKCTYFFREQFWKGFGASEEYRWAPLLTGGVFRSIYNFWQAQLFSSSLGDKTPPLQTAGDYTNTSWDTSVLYRRFLPEIKQTLVYRLIDLRTSFDINRLCSWSVDKRLKEDWFEKAKLDNMYIYLKNSNSLCRYTLIGELDEVPFCYVEVNEKDSCIRSDSITREGLSVMFRIIFNEHCLQNRLLTVATTAGLVHMLFLLDPNTTQIGVAPNVNNIPLIKCLCESGGFFHEVRTSFFGGEGDVLIVAKWLIL